MEAPFSEPCTLEKVNGPPVTFWGTDQSATCLRSTKPAPWHRPRREAIKVSPEDHCGNRVHCRECAITKQQTLDNPLKVWAGSLIMTVGPLANIIMGGLVFAGSSFIVCFPAALGEPTCASIAWSLFARPETFLRSTIGAWLGARPRGVDPKANDVGT